MRPWIAETKFGSGFFSGDFRWGFNGGAQGIIQRTGTFLIGVKNPPELVAALLNRGLVHGSSSPQPFVVVVYQLHHMHAQSV